jgi:hypothetical protein
MRFTIYIRKEGGNRETMKEGGREKKKGGRKEGRK